MRADKIETTGHKIPWTDYGHRTTSAKAIDISGQVSSLSAHPSWQNSGQVMIDLTFVTGTKVYGQMVNCGAKWNIYISDISHILHIHVSPRRPLNGLTNARNYCTNYNISYEDETVKS